MTMLDGPKEDRTHAAARARIPMTAANVRWIIAEMAEAKTSLPARKSLAEKALHLGNISDEGRAVYREYLASL